jgi:uncharacterized protein YfdQ (DUF2303 family)
MTDTTTYNIGAPTENDVLAKAATAAATPVRLNRGEKYAFRNMDGTIEIVDGDPELTAPERKTGIARVYDADSFGAYFTKHAQDEQSDIYGDPYGPAIVGVLNGHGRSEPDALAQINGFGDHRVELIFRQTPAWKRWSSLDGQLSNQVTFAQHLEDSLPDVVEPEGASMLELAQSFQAHTKVQFESGKDLGSGQRQLVYREEIAASAGAKGDITIPKEFVIGIAPYEGCGLYRVTARLRYRISDGTLTIGYKLDRPEDVLRVAFDEVLQRVQQASDRIALLGQPPV